MDVAHTPLGVALRDVERLRGGGGRAVDLVAEEAPVALLYNDVPFAVMMATPADLDDFARGFSLSEGLVDDLDQIRAIETVELLEGIQLRIAVAPGARAASLDGKRGRLLPGRSGCGICGTRELEDSLRPPPRLQRVARFDPALLERALAQLPRHQPMNAATGAVHAAFWIDADGRIALSREDVGRHNALDKLIGALRKRGIAPDAGMLLLTSRASYEMVAKAAHAGIGLVAAISAPTALAIDLARSAGMCLVGFARPGSCNVYARPEEAASP